jgi:hypothetical protein
MFFGHVIKAQPHRYMPPPSSEHQTTLTLACSVKMLDTVLRHNIRFIDCEAIRARSLDGRCKRLQPVVSCMPSSCPAARVTASSLSAASLESQVAPLGPPPSLGDQF